MDYEFLEIFKDVRKNPPPNYDDVCERALKNEVLMGLNTNKARYIYAQLPCSMFAKFFFLFLSIVSNPITIILALIFFIIYYSWFYIFFYWLILLSLTPIENLIIQKIIFSEALKTEMLYEKLYYKGVITIKFMENSNSDS